MTIKIIPDMARDFQISLEDEKADHAKTRVRLEDCSKELKALIIESNEKIGELNRDLETLPHEVFGLSHPAELEYRNTIDGLKQELSRYDHTPSAYRIREMEMEESVADLEKENAKLKEQVEARDEIFGNVNPMGNVNPIENSEIEAILTNNKKWEAWGKKLEAENITLVKKNIEFRKAIDTLIEESQKEG